MKRVWNTPELQELTIQSTAHGHYKGYGKGDDKGHGHGSGDGRDAVCRCQGGTSPCYRHHGLGESDTEDELS